MADARRFGPRVRTLAVIDGLKEGIAGSMITKQHVHEMSNGGWIRLSASGAEAETLRAFIAGPGQECLLPYKGDTTVMSAGVLTATIGADRFWSLLAEATSRGNREVVRLLHASVVTHALS